MGSRTGAEPARARVVLASNRGPVSFEAHLDGTFSASRGSGGLVTGLTSAAGSSSADDALWLAAALSDGDRAAARASGGRVDKVLADVGVDPLGVGVRLLDIPAEELDAAYNQVANRTLWFAAHGLFGMPWAPSFDAAAHRDWEAYVSYNQTFAEALAAESAEGARVLVQDYHLFLVPGMLRALRPDVKIAHFTHTPWAAPEMFRWLPDDMTRGIVTGLLGADRVGFHTRRWADEFMTSCRDVLGSEVSCDGDVVTYAGRRITVAVHPLGVDRADLEDLAAQPEVTDWRARLEADLGERLMVLRVDRTEPSKNILRGLDAFDELLTTHPEWRGKVVLHAYCNPSRTDISEYQDYSIAVHERAERINDSFTEDGWTPVVLKVDADHPRALAAMQIADVAMVNPVRDGMNLVAKEAVTLSRDGLALVLSRDAGAAAELGGDALLVNPFDISGTARALDTALRQSGAQRRERTGRMATIATGQPPSRWLHDQLAAL